MLEHWVEGRFGFRSRLSSVALFVLSSSAVGCPHGCGRGCGSGRVAWRGALCVGEQLDAFLGLPSWRVCAAVGVTCACPSPWFSLPSAPLGACRRQVFERDAGHSSRSARRAACDIAWRLPKACKTKAAIGLAARAAVAAVAKLYGAMPALRRCGAGSVPRLRKYTGLARLGGQDLDGNVSAQNHASAGRPASLRADWPCDRAWPRKTCNGGKEVARHWYKPVLRGCEDAGPWRHAGARTSCASLLLLGGGARGLPRHPGAADEGSLLRRLTRRLNAPDDPVQAL